MNASSILKQLMQQAGGQSSGTSGGMDLNKMMGGLTSQLTGGKGSSGVDLKSLLGGGALGLMIGSKRGRKMGGKALKYGAIAGGGLPCLEGLPKFTSRRCQQLSSSD